jgi:hypothetical protein
MKKWVVLAGALAVCAVQPGWAADKPADKAVSDTPADKAAAPKATAGEPADKVVAPKAASKNCPPASAREAEQAIRRAIELQPGATFYHTVLATIEVQRGNAQAALAAARQETPGWAQDAALALAQQIGSDRSAADAALRMLIEKHAPYGIADVYALRNDANATFEWLDRASNNRKASIVRLLFDPFILRYKDDPRFAVGRVFRSPDQHFTWVGFAATAAVTPCTSGAPSPVEDFSR